LGFPSIQHVINLYQFNHDLSDQTLRHILRDLIIVSEDTVLLKRAGSLDKYYETKELIKKVNINSIEEVKSFTDYAISNDLSFGGSADLLIAYLYLKHIHHNLLI
jgi:triphosphoribosyl-dephospho-CoA synthetase